MVNTKISHIYESKFMEILIDNDNHIMKNCCKTADLQLNDFREELNVWMKLMAEYSPKLLLSNNEIGHILTTDMQKWVCNYLFSNFKSKGILRWAIILSSDLFSNISVEQMLHNCHNLKDVIYFQIFEDERDAEEWLFLTNE